MTKTRTDRSFLFLADNTPDAVAAAGDLVSLSDSTDALWTARAIDEQWMNGSWEIVCLPGWYALLQKEGNRMYWPSLWMAYGDAAQLIPVREAGAADFLVSPWSAGEAHVRAVAIDHQRQGATPLVLNGRRLEAGHSSVILSPVEARVVAVLLARRDRVVAREIIMSAARVRSLDVCISKLRRKMDPFLKRAGLNCEIQTEFGFGYVFRSTPIVDKLWKSP